ncbi:MAG: twin-arginine translocation signal domain-containing protein [Firmicutes bacterium]|nr:twin-arginine translocation signal domain-containing protein [Bacillota bacterium]MCL5039211.1 twin-arginine translocation signal domain-containing protein [Bacillota bacterium]
MLSRKISRRTFIKASALTGAGLAVLGPVELGRFLQRRRLERDAGQS